MRENGECHVGNKFWHDLALTTDNCNLSLLLSLPKIIAKTKLSAHTAFPTSENFSQMKSLLLSSSPASPASLSKTNSENDALFGHHEINSSSSHCYFLSVHNRNHSAPPLRARLDTRFSYSTPKRLRSVKFVFVAKAADSTQPSTSVSTSSSDKTLVSDEGFSLSKISFGVVGLGVGISLLSYGFGAYFNILPGSEWSAIMLTYGFPLAIIGMALKYAELKPVPCITYADALALRETSATPILKQVRSDVTRYRYGDEQHLDEALKRIFQYGLGGGIPRRSAPILQKMREEVTDEGKYSLVLVFEAKDLKLSDFEQRQAKFASFFGPDITAEVGKAEDNLYEVKLISNLTAKASSS